MVRTIRRMVGMVVLLFGCMIVAYGHQSCEEQRSRAEGFPVAHVHMHAQLDPTDAKDMMPQGKAKFNARESAMVLPQTEPKAGASGCLRSQCNCTSSTHNNPYCRATGGDCVNHPGLLCIW
jgi:hypothetical protein